MTITIYYCNTSYASQKPSSGEDCCIADAVAMASLFCIVKVGMQNYIEDFDILLTYHQMLQQRPSFTEASSYE